MSSFHDKRQLKKWSFILYTTSYFFPIFWKSDYFGIEAIVLGWMGLFDSALEIGLPWLANLLFIASLLFFNKKPTAKLTLSSIAVVFGLFALDIKEVLIDEGGQTEEVTVGLGFFVWITSFLILSIDNYRYLKERKRDKV